MSKLRSDELVNMEGDGAPSFPQGATSIEPTTDNQVATKLYVDSALSAAAGNAVSSTAPTNPAIGSFWTDTSVSPSLLKTWNGSMWIEFAGTAAAAVGVVVSLPSLSATNLEYAPATITAAAAQVSNATLYITKWYKDDVEIPGATGSTYVATEPGVYRYEERWADNAGNILTPSLNKTLQVLAIATPSITSPVVDTGVPDFVYTAASSAIANINTVDALSNEDAFSVYLQSSTSNQPLNIDNGLDFATHGGLIWLKSRNGSGIYNSNVFIDTERGADIALFSNSTNANSVLTGAPYSSSFDSDGFTWGSEDNFHPSGRNYASWSFLQSPGFFDVVTYTGSGVTRTVPHNLGSAPGMIIIKGSNISGTNWAVYHKELDVNDVAFLNYTSQASEDVSNRFAGVHPTSTEFTVGTSQDTNYTGSEYVAYVFADNPSNEIKCGTFSNNTGNWGTPASEDATVDCGFEPQFVIAKLATAGSTTQAGGWYVMDSTRGWGSGMYNQSIQTNETNAETADTNFNFTPTSTGFIVTYSSPGDHIYLAIGSPKISVSNTQLTLTDTTVSKVSDGSLIGGTTIDEVLTVGETVQADTAVSGTVSVPVFEATTYTGNFPNTGGGETQKITTGIDNTGKALIWQKCRTQNGSYAFNHQLTDTLRGAGKTLITNNSWTEKNERAATEFFNDGFTAGDYAITNMVGNDFVAWNFRAAPGFFDIVAYDGDGVAGRALNHQLGSVPGCVIIKSLSQSTDWFVWHKENKNPGEVYSQSYLKLNTTDDTQRANWIFYSGQGTLSSTQFGGLGPYDGSNQLGEQYIAYLFADTPGVIKCGTYTGTGSFQTIDTGFKPEFVITKSRSHSSDWYLMDSENSGQALYTNSNNGQQTVPIGYVNNGFTVDGRNLALNEIGYEYIYLAIAENAEVDITSDIRASGTISASSGNTITLSDVSGTWSTGMKIQGTDSDNVDNPDLIDASAVTFTSSEPATTSGTVSAWDHAEWNLSHDSAFSGVVHQKAVPLTATGTQTGPDDFTIQPGTEYFVRTKYASFLPTGQSDWSAVTRFLTKASVYADDVFSTYLYEGTGDGSAQTITNGIDLSGEGGLVWSKKRNASNFHVLSDTERGVHKYLKSDGTDAEISNSGYITQFNSDGYAIGGGGNINYDDMVSWTFRKAPGFFDVQTWTGDGTSFRQIAHDLGSEPGMILVKCTSDQQEWVVWHRSAGQYEGRLNETAPFQWEYITGASSTDFTITHAGTATNQSGRTYVAYIFAHDDQSFGTNGDESIIKCGSFSYTGGTPLEVNLGWEAQWVLVKRTDGVDSWFLADTMRGMIDGDGAYLQPNTANAEGPYGIAGATSTGFIFDPGTQIFSTGSFIYMAIRRPHKPPTAATEVFKPVSRSGTASNTSMTGVGFAPDTHFSKILSNGNTYQNLWFDKLMGPGTYIKPATTAAENTSSNIQLSFDQDGVTFGNGNNANGSGLDYINYFFKRAPGFFDVVAYTGDGTINRTIPHNLGVVPELVIAKRRSSSGDWWVGAADILGSGKFMYLSRDNAKTPNIGTYGVFGTHTATTIGLETAQNNDTNHNNSTYVTYLFATLDGISKVGSYTGTGSNIDVDCGFAAGARFVLIKRTDSTGDWYVWDTERGIGTGNDPYSLLNTTDAEVTSTDYIDPLNAGFTVTSSAPTAINASGGEYLFLAIA